MDRLVCADGGNPDPTTTHGEHAAEAEAVELRGWAYPRLWPAARSQSSCTGMPVGPRACAAAFTTG
jgi:hypothetical protein